MVLNFCIFSDMAMREFAKVENLFHSILPSMAVRVVDFSNGVYEIRKILHKNQHTERKLLNFENWTNEPQ